MMSEKYPMMINRWIVSFLLILLPFTADVVSATNRPGSAFSVNVISDIITAAPLQFTPEDIQLCCTGVGDFGFMLRDLQIDSLATDTDADGFLAIPGNSLWTCRRACRDPANGFDLEECNEVCDCRQGCPTSDDALTVACRDECNFNDPIEQDLCFETCHLNCGERCRSTYNGYVIPLGLYGEALKLLDCFFGDLIGDQANSCASGMAYWEARGYTCTLTPGGGFDCECNVLGTCPNVEYPCKFDFHCISEAPSLVPSESPSDVPSYIPSTSPSASPSDYPTWSPTPKPTKGKAGRPIHDSDDEVEEDDDDDFEFDDDEEADDDSQQEGMDDDIASKKKKSKKHSGDDYYSTIEDAGVRRRKRSRRGRRRDRRIVN